MNSKSDSKLLIGSAAAVMSALAGCAQPAADDDVTFQVPSADSVTTCDPTLVSALKDLLASKEAGDTLNKDCITLGTVYDEEDFPILGRSAPKEVAIVATSEVLVNGLKALLHENGFEAAMENGGVVLGLPYDEEDFPIVGAEHVTIKVKQ